MNFEGKIAIIAVRNYSKSLILSGFEPKICPKSAKFAVLAVLESKIIGAYPPVLDRRLTNPPVKGGRWLRARNATALPESGNHKDKVF